MNRFKQRAKKTSRGRSFIELALFIKTVATNYDLQLTDSRRSPRKQVSLAVILNTGLSLLYLHLLPTTQTNATLSSSFSVSQQLNTNPSLNKIRQCYVRIRISPYDQVAGTKTAYDWYNHEQRGIPWKANRDDLHRQLGLRKLLSVDQVCTHVCPLLLSRKFSSRFSSIFIPCNMTEKHENRK